MVAVDSGSESPLGAFPVSFVVGLLSLNKECLKAINVYLDFRGIE